MSESLPPCKNFDDPDVPEMGAGGCKNQSDPRYTMDFTNVEPGAFIYWCAECGPAANAMNDALQAAFDERGDDFTKQLEEAIEQAERKQ